MDKLTIVFLLIISAFLFSENAYSQCCSVPGTQYSCNNTNWLLNDATAALAGCRAGNQNECRRADMLIDRADVAVIQLLTECTKGNCLRGSLTPLEDLARRISDRSRDLQNLTGMRRSYANTLNTVRSWSNTKQCGVQTNQQRCKQYADSAVRLNQMNISKGCGYTGSKWTWNYTRHYSWCLGASENAAYQEKEARKILIDNCAVGRNIDCSKCSVYEKWLKQNGRACGYHGNRLPSICANDPECVRWNKECNRVKKQLRECLAQCQ